MKSSRLVLNSTTLKKYDMQPDKADRQLLYTFFKVLGYGNKCSVCHKEGTINQVTENLVTFHCTPCKRGWAFDVGALNKSKPKK